MCNYCYEQIYSFVCEEQWWNVKVILVLRKVSTCQEVKNLFKKTTWNLQELQFCC